MSKETATRIDAKTAILSAGEAKRHGHDRLFRTEGVRKIEMTDGPTIEVKAVLALNQREVTVRNGDGQQQAVALAEIQFIHVDSAIANHLGCQ